MTEANFLRHEYISLLKTVPADAARHWGKMNFQQSVEHMADSVRIANGKEPHTLLTPEEQMPRMQDFIRSEKLFRENTPNRLLPDEPAEVKHATLNAAIDELEQELHDFFAAFEGKPEHRVMNPFFGNLDFSLWCRLLYKHAWHHLKQFGVEPIQPE